MALGTASSRSVVSGSKMGVGALPIIPVSTMGDWVDVCTDATAADNSGSTVLAPGALTRAALNVLGMNGAGTTLQIRLKYDSTKSVTTAPVVQAFGFDGGGADTAFDGTRCAPERLVDVDGTHEQTLSTDTSNDVKATITADSITWGYTASKEVDANGAAFVMVTVKTAAVQASSGIPRVQVRVK